MGVTDEWEGSGCWRKWKGFRRLMVKIRRRHPWSYEFPSITEGVTRIEVI